MEGIATMYDCKRCPLCKKNVISAVDAQEFCALCGMPVERNALVNVIVENEFVSFCSDACQKKYKKTN